AGALSLQPPPAYVGYRIELELRRGLPVLALSGTKPRVSARVGRSSEADLVPRPRMGVERAQHAAHHHAPRLRDGQLPVELPFGELLDEFVLQLAGGRGEPLLAAALAGAAVEVGGD